METYLLCGMYIDYGYFNVDDKRREIGKEIKRRWEENIHREEFDRYFADHGVSPETLNLI